MSTYKVSLQWDFIVEAESDTAAKMAVAELTAHAFTSVADDESFAYENLTAYEIDSRGAGVDARL